uniref:Uncharacterized protein n=1 Tax=Oryza sativa subsp. japonica TaxID=39947 RepID=Q8H3H2_ORYSJ|nr:hypothetical protein [Oryza sativa Japonica Group]
MLASYAHEIIVDLPEMRKEDMRMKVGSGASSTSPTNVNLIAATLDNTCSIVWFRKLASDQIKNTLLPLLQSWPPATAVLPISR